MTNQSLFDFDEAAPGPSDTAQEITHANLAFENVSDVGQPGGMGEEKVGSSPYYPIPSRKEVTRLVTDGASGAAAGSVEARLNDHALCCSQRDQSCDSSSTWHEVPQERFLSWSVEMQHAYCAARDRDAALHAESFEQAEWYRWRASLYET